MFGVLMMMIKPSLCFITVMPSPLITAAVTRILLKIVSVRRRILNSEHNCSTFGREENKYVGSWKRMLSLERWNYLRFLKLDDCESPGLPRSKVKGEDKLWQWHWVDAERAEKRMDLFQIIWQNMFTSSHNVLLVMFLIIAGWLAECGDPRLCGECQYCWLVGCWREEGRATTEYTTE